MTRRSLLFFVLCASAAPAAFGAPAGSGPPATASAEAQVGLDPPDIALLVDMLKGAEAQGLTGDGLAIGDAQMGLRSADPDIRAGAQERLEAAVIAYARAQHGGRLAPARFPFDWAIRPKAYDAAADFAQARRNHAVAAWAASLAPTDARYGALVQAYARYSSIAAAGGWPTLSPGPSLKPGASGARVGALRKRLAVEDPDTPPAAAVAPDQDTYDAALAAAVSRAQARYGLGADGSLGVQTLRA